MDGAPEERQERGQLHAPRVLALVHSCPSAKILIMIKCPLVTVAMARCGLLNVIFAKQNRYNPQPAMPLDPATSFRCAQKLNKSRQSK